ncbi:MAG: filamentous hemagglutinin N-terminal domain-containing protein, partial [Pseudanabaena sp.]
MQLSLHDFWISGMVLLGWSVTAFPANSQIIPDQSLPINSVVTKSGLTHTITGGTTRGVNLYHSFQEFSVPFNNTAYFNNASHVQNIVTRVTGNSTSNIDGLIKANGNANLFLLNPQGITFGTNAKLDIGGTFVGTTASNFKLTDGSEFSATNPQAPPLLTSNITQGLQYGMS